MKDRRPRKLKKVMKKRFSVIMAVKMARCALISGMTSARIAVISAMTYQNKAEKALSILETVKDTAQLISGVMNEKPKKWIEI